jgi:hypothetical protein
MWMNADCSGTPLATTPQEFGPTFACTIIAADNYLDGCASSVSTIYIPGDRCTGALKVSTGGSAMLTCSGGASAAGALSSFILVVALLVAFAAMF